MKSVKELLKNYGIEMEPNYIIYRTAEKVLAIPYLHIKIVELRENKVVIYTGGIEKTVFEFPSRDIANLLFENILLHIEKEKLNR